MRILFLISDSPDANPYCKAFAVEFAQFLSLRHSVVLCHSVLNDAPSDWDLAIVQDVRSQQNIIETRKQESTPHIFISHFDNWQAQPVLNKYLLKVLYTANVRACPSLPLEIIHRCKKPVFVSREWYRSTHDASSQVKARKIIHFHQESDRNMNVLRAIVQFANRNQDVHLSIVANNDVLAIAKGLINGNISLDVETTYEHASLASFDLAITSDYHALECIMTGIPTVIIGSRGFGGLISNDNLEDHLKWHFSGRIGGESEEIIPVEIIQDEFEYIQSSFPSILVESMGIALKIRKIHGRDSIFRQMETGILLECAKFRALQSRDHALRPRINSNIKPVRSPSRMLFHLVNAIGKIVGAVSDVEMKVIRHFDGVRDIVQIAAETDTEVEDVRLFVQELWSEKIVSI